MVIRYSNLINVCCYKRSTHRQNITKLTQTIDELSATDFRGYFLLARPVHDNSKNPVQIRIKFWSDRLSIWGKSFRFWASPHEKGSWGSKFVPVPHMYAYYTVWHRATNFIATVYPRRGSFRRRAIPLMRCDSVWRKVVKFRKMHLAEGTACWDWRATQGQVGLVCCRGYALYRVPFYFYSQWSELGTSAKFTSQKRIRRKSTRKAKTSAKAADRGNS